MDHPVLANIKTWFVYILLCADNTFYTGYTSDLEKRIHTHNKGKGAKYTRARLPVTLLYSEKYNNKSIAMSREYKIKQLSRFEKEDIVYGKKFK